MAIKDSLTLWSGALIAILVAFTTHLLAAARARKEQELSLRRDIYLAAIEAAQAGMEALSQIANSNISDAELATRPYRDKAPSIAKVYLVAKIDVLKAFTKFRDDLDVALLRTIMYRAPQDKDSTEKQIALLKQWNQDADSLGRQFTSVVSQIRSELGLKIKEELLHEIFDESRTKRSYMVESILKHCREWDGPPNAN